MRPGSPVCASLLGGLVVAACGGPAATGSATPAPLSEMERRVAQFTSVRLAPDISHLSDAQRQMIRLLIEAADAMDRVFWQQAYGDRAELLARIPDPATRRYAEIHYGPWDRLEEDAPFVEGYGPKPKGARFYPEDASVEEIEQAARLRPEIVSLYTLVRRTPDGLEATPYHVAWKHEFELAADRLRGAAALSRNASLRRYLELRADALESGDYRASDLAWMDVEDNDLDVVIGPIETYEDLLLGYKAAATAYVLLRDRAWSLRLQRYAALLPELQRGLPVPDAYKAETPGSDADLGAYDTLYVGGDANAAVKSLAFNLPNDEQVQLEKGTRRVQLKSAMRAKFDRIMVPIAGVLLAEEQRGQVTFDAFFANGMFHEVAHGLGIKNTLNGRSSVREALKDHASALEEGKADVLGLYMVQELHKRGELGQVDLGDYYTTFLAGIFRAIRFGSTSAHGVANLIRYNFFEERGAFTREPDGRYRVDHARFPAAVEALSERLLRLQGDGDYGAVADFVARYGVRTPRLENDLARVAAAEIPVDIVFEQGPAVLGLE